MRSDLEQQKLAEPIDARELRLLAEVEFAPEATQRELSKRAGMALGLTNLMLRGLAQKGYIRATQAGWKRWLYNLTPKGFSRKLHLTIAYVHRVMDHYQSVRSTLREQIEPLNLNAESRVAIIGTGEFAELVYLGLREIGIDEIDVYDDGSLEGERFLGMPIRKVATLGESNYDRVVLGSLGVTPDDYSSFSSLDVTPEKMVVFFMDGFISEAA
jgi:hypothetical protein